MQADFKGREARRVIRATGAMKVLAARKAHRE